MYCILLSATLVVCGVDFFSIIRTNERFSLIACQILYHAGPFGEIYEFVFSLMVILKKKKDYNVSEAHLKLKKFLIHAWLQ